METRVLGRTGRPVSVIGLGCWQLGADWGAVQEEDALAILAAAADAGVTFFDTADVYGDGRSERLIGRFLAERPGHGITVATKMGRRAAPHVADAYTLDNFRTWTDRSRENLGVDTLDLVQLHCPPSSVFDRDATYDALDVLVADGVAAAYGVSVETESEALAAIARPHVASIQIILNAFRRKPLERVLPAAAAAGVGIIARVPLASGLLSGKYDLSTVFAPDDHRSYNREGQHFDVGETFAGVPFEVGVAAAPARRGSGHRGVDHGAARAAVDRRPGGGHHRDPRSPDPRAGPGECGRRRARPPRPADPRCPARDLRRGHPRPRPPPLVGRQRPVGPQRGSRSSSHANTARSYRSRG